MKNTYLNYPPEVATLIRELIIRAECSEYGKRGRICDEVYKDVIDWCNGCLFKAVIDKTRSREMKE